MQLHEMGITNKLLALTFDQRPTGAKAQVYRSIDTQYSQFSNQHNWVHFSSMLDKQITRTLVFDDIRSIFLQYGAGIVGSTAIFVLELFGFFTGVSS